jgi:large exoprotein involved in heme utilization and adhesion
VLAKQLTASNGAQILAINFGQGNNGDVNVESNELHLTTTDIDVGIFTSSISNTGRSSGGTGNLTVTSHNNLRLDNGGRINTENFGTGSSGDLVVNANNIVLIGYKGQQKTGILNNKYPGSTKKPGTLTVNSNNLTIKNGAQISSFTAGSADAGNIYVNSKQIEISSDGDKITGITTQTQGSGNAADISIKTNYMDLSGENAYLSAGVENSGTDIQNSGAAGNISIEGVVDNSDEHGMVSTTKAEHILIRDGAAIGTTSFINNQNAGDITINTALLEIDNDSSLISSTAGSADSGNILINANDIVLNNSRISAFTNASGNAGFVEINTDTLKMQNDSNIITGTSDIATGHGGDINITVKNFDLNDSHLHAGTTASSTANPEIDRAGNIVINATGTINLENQSFFTSFGVNENAGNITIKGGNLLRLSGDSKILTAIISGSGTGGDIFINTPIVALDDSFITSKADKGNGGDITLTGLLFISPLSAITASSKLSAAGELNLKPVTNISGAMAVLPQSLLNASEHLSDRCGNRSEKNKNSFMIKSRGGVPLSPGKLTPSTLIDITTPIDQHFGSTKSVNKQVSSLTSTKHDKFLAFNQQVGCRL